MFGNSIINNPRQRMSEWYDMSYEILVMGGIMMVQSYNVWDSNIVHSCNYCNFYTTKHETSLQYITGHSHLTYPNNQD